MDLVNSNNFFDIKNIIKKKRDGRKLQEAEVNYIVEVVVNGGLDREQIGEWLLIDYLCDITP